MKKLFLFAAASAILFVACKKSDDDGNSGLGSNQFKIGTTTYNDVFLSSLFGYFSAVSPSGGSLQMRFFNDIPPVTSGTFKVAFDVDAADEIEIIAIGNFNGTSKSYVAGYVAGQTATVSVNNGKYSVQFNNVSARNMDDTTESVLVSANVSQN